MGKGSKERLVPFGVSLKEALNEYLKRRGDIEDQPHVFLTQFAEPVNRRMLIHIRSDT